MKRNIMKSLTGCVLAAVLTLLLCGCGIITVHFGSEGKAAAAGSETASKKVLNLDIEWAAGEINIVF